MNENMVLRRTVENMQNNLRLLRDLSIISQQKYIEMFDYIDKSEKLSLDEVDSILNTIIDDFYLKCKEELNNNYCNINPLVFNDFVDILNEN